MEGIQHVLSVTNPIQGRSAEYGYEGEEKEGHGTANGVDEDFDNLGSMGFGLEFLYLFFIIVFKDEIGAKRLSRNFSSEGGIKFIHLLYL